MNLPILCCHVMFPIFSLMATYVETLFKVQVAFFLHDNVLVVCLSRESSICTVGSPYKCQVMSFYALYGAFLKIFANWIFLHNLWPLLVCCFKKSRGFLKSYAVGFHPLKIYPMITHYVGYLFLNCNLCRCLCDGSCPLVFKSASHLIYGWLLQLMGNMLLFFRGESACRESPQWLVCDAKPSQNLFFALCYLCFPFKKRLVQK